MNKNYPRLARPYPLPPADFSEPHKWNRPLFSLYECLDVSQELLDSYWKWHTLPHVGDGPLQAEALTTLAVARHEFLLQQGRKELSGQFSEADISVLLTCYMGAFVAPDDFDELAEVVASSDSVRYLHTRADHAALVERLRALTSLQRTALFDAMELIHFSEHEPLDVLRQLHIQLRREPFLPSSPTSALHLWPARV